MSTKAIKVTITVLALLFLVAGVWSWDTAMDTIRSRSGDSTSVNAAMASIAHNRVVVDRVDSNVSHVVIPTQDSIWQVVLKLRADRDSLRAELQSLRELVERDGN
ncbi:MAG: hypothetical protein AB1752_13485 [Candidatus Zixiibacteriota bacterium]